jgi:hypothetical protein
MRALIVVASLFAVGCHLAPAAKSPLKEKLAPLTQDELEEATRKCLVEAGWTVDSLPSRHGDLDSLHAKKKDYDASLYFYPKGMTPRITGDLAEDADPLWPCLDRTLR